MVRSHTEIAKRFGTLPELRGTLDHFVEPIDVTGLTTRTMNTMH